MPENPSEGESWAWFHGHWKKEETEAGTLGEIYQGLPQQVQAQPVVGLD